MRSESNTIASLSSTLTFGRDSDIPAATHFGELFWRGVELFNAGAYFEAHEAWEEIWVEAEGDERRFLQALIHFAVGCHHRQRGNSVGAERQWDKGAAKIQPFLPAWGGIRTAPLLEAAQTRRAPFPSIEIA